MESYVNGIKPYRVSSHDIWKLDEAERNSYLKLDWNEATVPPSPKVRKKMKELVLEDNFYQWYPNTYNTELVSKIAAYVGVENENIQIFPSSDTLQEYIVRCWLKEGDKVLILWPAYDNFRASAEAAGAEVVYSLLVNFRFCADKLEKDIETYHPRLVYLSNPNNPTGEQINVTALAGIMEKNKNVMFLLDEAYAEFSGQTAAKLTTVFQNLLVSRTFSKAFALANFRIGYLVSIKENVEIITKVRNSKNIPTFSQEAAIMALDDTAYMERYVTCVRNAREMFMDEMKKYSDIISIYPSEANFLMMKLKDREMKRRFLDFMKENHIYIRDLQQDILSDCYVRITVGTAAQMERVVKTVGKFKEVL